MSSRQAIEKSRPNIQTYEYDQIIAYNKKTILYVGGLEEKVDEVLLRDTFIAFGEILNVQIPRDPGTDAHRGFGFVEFEETEDAKHAMDNMMDSEIYGRVIKVNIAKPNAMKSQAVWSADADKWFQGKLGENAQEIDQEVRRNDAQAKAIKEAAENALTQEAESRAPKKLKTSA